MHDDTDLYINCMPIRTCIFQLKAYFNRQIAIKYRALVGGLTYMKYKLMCIYIYMLYGVDILYIDILYSIVGPIYIYFYTRHIPQREEACEDKDGAICP